MDSSPDRAPNKISPLNCKHPDSQNEFSPFRAETSDNDLRTTDHFVPQDSLEFSAGSNANHRREKSVELDPKYQTAPFTLNPGPTSFESRNVPPSHYTKRNNQKNTELRAEDLDTVQERSIEQSITTAKQQNENENSRAFNSDNFTSERSHINSRLNESERHLDKPRNITVSHRDPEANYAPTDRDYGSKNYQSPEFQTERQKSSEKRRELVTNSNSSHPLWQSDLNQDSDTYQLRRGDSPNQKYNNRTQAGGHSHKNSEHLTYSAYKAAKSNNNQQIEEENLASSKNPSSFANSQQKSTLSSVSKNERGSAFDLPASDKYGVAVDNSTEIQLLRQQLARLDQKLKAKEELLNQMKGYHNDLWVSYDQAQKEIQQLKSGKDHRTDELKSENKALKQKLTELEDSNYLLQKENQELRENYKEQKERLNELSDQNESLKEELKVFVVRLQKAQSESHSKSRRSNVEEKGDEIRYQENARSERTRMAQTTHKKVRGAEEETYRAGSLDNLRLKLEEYQRVNAELHEENQSLMLELKSRPTLRQFKELEAKVKHYENELGNENKDVRNSTEMSFYKRVLSDIRNELGLESITDVVPKIQSLIAQNKHNEKFNHAIIDMIYKCAPDGYFDGKPTLKQAWKYVKRIMEEFVQLKKTVLTASTGNLRTQRTLNSVMDYLMITDDSQLPQKLKELVSENNHMDMIIAKFKSLTDIDGMTLEELDKTLDFELHHKTIESSRMNAGLRV